MKLVKKIFNVLAILLFLVVIVIALFYRQEAYRLYKVVTFFEPENISENFREIESIFPTRLVPKSTQPYSFSYSNKEFVIPENFRHNDSIINTQSYLDYTLTDALLVIHNDSIIHEYYGNGFQSKDTHIAFSMSKSVVSALIGIAIEEGDIKSVQNTVTEYLPEFEGTGYDGVQIKEVLQMSSGVRFNEDYSDFFSDINIMGRYFAIGKPMRKFAKILIREREPGTYNQYVSIDTQVLGMILTKATGMSISEYMSKKLWEPIGAESDAFWIIDNEGMEFAVGGLNCTAKDYAKIGQLFLNLGEWDGKQVVPREWVIASITPDAPHLMPGIRPNAKSKDGYGYQWWIPLGADDEFNAQGIYTQFIYVDPNKDLVIVKLSSNYHFKTDTTGYFHDHEIALYRTIAKSLGLYY
ncbi:serine hydrolase domain-containing protein [Gaetbulibacter saemankumensis]|uniref:serine hydrolase domain-containing protein n=1 Tax=Gaetbulibacter saemankumensis TaxID=311208 RepID=UPI0006850233|nr:serine hydrolase [Gaetbulibacter saemankumensis]